MNRFNLNDKILKIMEKILPMNSFFTLNDIYDYSFEPKRINPCLDCFEQSDRQIIKIWFTSNKQIPRRVEELGFQMNSKQIDMIETYPPTYEFYCFEEDLTEIISLIDYHYISTKSINKVIPKYEIIHKPPRNLSSDIFLTMCEKNMNIKYKVRFNTKKLLNDVSPETEDSYTINNFQTIGDGVILDNGVFKIMYIIDSQIHKYEIKIDSPTFINLYGFVCCSISWTSSIKNPIIEVIYIKNPDRIEIQNFFLKRTKSDITKNLLPVYINHIND